ncbi:MAG: site-specific integrase [Ruminococcus sp.]|nr:site-specific integrase [Ruminococcus sp.]
MAYIEKRKNRKGEFAGYRIRAYSGYDVNGKQMVQYKSWTPPKDMSPRQAEKEVQRLAVLFDEECSHGQVTAAVKLQKLCEQWFSEYAELNHRSTTLQREHLIASRVYPALGHLRIDKISARDIQKFINSLARPGANKRTGQPLSQKTMQHHLSFISSIFEYAIRLDMVTTNPCSRVTIPKIDANGNVYKKPEKHIYTKEETREFMQILAEAPMKYKVFFTLAIYTGCRRGELLGIEWKNIDLEKATLMIDHTSNYTAGKGIYTDITKTDKSTRLVDLPPTVVELLKAYKHDQDSYKAELGCKWHEHDRLFTKWDGEPMSLNAPYTWLRKQCKKIDFPFYGVHTFRHLNASLQINAGVDPTTVAASLGHSTPQTTLSIYSHFFNEAKIKASNAIAEALGA